MKSDTLLFSVIIIWTLNIGPSFLLCRIPQSIENKADDCNLWYNICLNTCKGEAIIYLYTIVGFVANGLVSFYLHARHISLNRYFTYLTSDHKIKTIPPFYPRRLVIHGWLSHLQSFRWWGEWCRSSYDMPLSCFSHLKEQKAEIAPLYVSRPWRRWHVGEDQVTESCGK